ncbi:hypothetical protein [Streptomyces sp. B21-108]|jgi:hypothetical protein|uniref:hypothetical protein n=1 Tax=Streptomyces sp. B21-108 TaxID=3039419 RepID=UPI003FA6D5F3
MTATLLPASTRKGLFLAHRRDGAWEFEEPHFPYQAVYAEDIHARHPGGPRLAGARAARRALPGGDGTSLERVWQLIPA